MARASGLLVILVVLETIAPAPRAFAQGQKPGAIPQPVVSGSAIDVLPGLPRPPDAPASLLKAPSAVPPYTCDPLPGPYFERDPLLDPPELPPPGWFADVELGVVGPHFKNR